MEFAREDLKVYNTKATVEVSEPLGSEVLFHVKFGENTFSARVDPHTKAKIGEQISLVFNMNKMHVFDTETEQNLIY
jgi:multiple sugar transport system ATP-binding protein